MARLIPLQSAIDRGHEDGTLPSGTGAAARFAGIRNEWRRAGNCGRTGSRQDRDRICSAEEPRASDDLAGQFFFAVAHEFGHLSFDVYDIAVFGREEDAADSLAAYIMLQFHEDARRLVAGAAYSYHRMLMQDRQQDSKATLRLAAFSSNHGQPEERFFNLMCTACGSGDKQFADLVEKGYLTQSRAKDCKYEFEVLQYAFQKEVSPHIDKDKAATVLGTDWLAGIAPPPRAR